MCWRRGSRWPQTSSFAENEPWQHPSVGCTVGDGPRRMNPVDFGDSWIFPMFVFTWNIIPVIKKYLWCLAHTHLWSPEEESGAVSWQEVKLSSDISLSPCCWRMNPDDFPPERVWFRHSWRQIVTKRGDLLKKCPDSPNMWCRAWTWDGWTIWKRQNSSSTIQTLSAWFPHSALTFSQNSGRRGGRWTLLQMVPPRHCERKPLLLLFNKYEGSPGALQLPKLNLLQTKQKQQVSR